MNPFAKRAAAVAAATRKPPVAKPARTPTGTGRLATSGRMDGPGYKHGGKVTAKKTKPKAKRK